RRDTGFSHRRCDRDRCVAGMGSLGIETGTSRMPVSWEDSQIPSVYHAWLFPIGRGPNLWTMFLLPVPSQSMIVGKADTPLRSTVRTSNKTTTVKRAVHSVTSAAVPVADGRLSADRVCSCPQRGVPAPATPLG